MRKVFKESRLGSAVCLRGGDGPNKLVRGGWLGGGGDRRAGWSTEYRFI